MHGSHLPPQMILSLVSYSEVSDQAFIEAPHAVVGLATSLSTQTVDADEVQVAFYGNLRSDGEQRNAR